MRKIIKKAREFQKNIYFCFIDYTKAFDCVDHNKLWIILKEMGIPGHLTCLLRNLYAGQEATIRIGHGTTDWFQIGKGVWGGLLVTGCRVLIWGNETEERFCRWVVGRSNVPYSINVLKVPEPHT